MKLKDKELKDVVLSALAEIEDKAEHDNKEHDNKEIETLSSSLAQHDANDGQHASSNASVSQAQGIESTEATSSSRHDNQASIERANAERLFLEAVKERLLVLFEGFQSPNNVAIEAKVELTLNFLEYLLATVQSRLSELQERPNNESI